MGLILIIYTIPTTESITFHQMFNSGNSIVSIFVIFLNKLNFFFKRVGHNEYLKEFHYFNPWINSNGLVTWVPEVKLHTKCVIKVKDFPFDTQCCEINFYSWAHTSSQLELFLFENKNVTNLTHLAYNTEWFIYHTCALNTTLKTSQNLEWWVTSYVIYIKRESIYHFYTLLMPCGSKIKFFLMHLVIYILLSKYILVLSMLSILLFWLPPESNEKITLGVTILLAFFVNSLVVSNYTPEAASELPVIGVYYTFNIFMVAIALTGAVLILKLHFRGQKLNKVPNLIKRIFLIHVDSCKVNKSTVKKKSNNVSHINSFANRRASPCYTIESSSNSTIETDHLNALNNLTKFTKQTMESLNHEKIKSKNIEQIMQEWKQVASRLEKIFLFCIFITVVITPILLFGKFVIRDIHKDILMNKYCGCENSFLNSFKVVNTIY
jgi:hypothetical protein